ncbi:excisionase [Massilia antarctica]|uniref:excisionase n=1 Tax=Massilia antarctica TaxID=2765360 RepID=UPI00226EA565|nr:excisionase [Massilia sp. H27-R4]MCY0913219.1 excisionase [Massilia sp. H27-R4]
MGDLSVRLEWVLIPMFCSLTGYTPKAVTRKIGDGVWLRGKHYQKAPDGRITINLQRYYEWVEGQRPTQ